MKALLDTHTILWFATDSSRLSATAKRLLEGTGHQFFISPITAFEIGIKWLRGKLKLDAPPSEYIPFVVEHMSLIPLPVTIAHGLAVSRLPLHHADPFDRLLIAQAIQEDLPIITGDRLIRRYDVKIVW